MVRRRAIVLVAFLSLLPVGAAPGVERDRLAVERAAPETVAGPEDDPTAGNRTRRTFYQVFGRTPRLNHEPMGPAKVTVGGVPAEPVDSFNWDGVGSNWIDGEIIMNIDPVANTGFIQATWTDQYGEWSLVVTEFQHPHHGAGTRFGPSTHDRHIYLKDAITTNSYLHGDTDSGQPVLPTLFTYLAAWGPAVVTLNGQPFASPFELPVAPLWEAHFMVSEGVREPDGTVRAVDGSIYNPSKKAEGLVDPYDLEVHVVFHDTWFPTTTNIPPLYQFFYHLVFENVSMSITSIETPLSIER